MVGNGEVVEFAAPQLGANRTAVGRAMEIEAQDLGFSPLPQAGLTGLLPTARATMPALPFDLLAQVVLQLQSEPGLAAAEPFGYLLEVTGANGTGRQLAQEGHQLGHRLLELIGLAEVAAVQHLVDLPIEPKGRLIEQGAVIRCSVVLQKFVGILAAGQVQHPQFQLALEGQLLHLANGPLGGPNPGAIGVEVQDQALAVAATAELGDLLIAQRRAKSRHRIGDASRVERDDVEVALDHDSAIGLANRINRLVEAKEVFALLKDLRLRRVQILGLSAIEAAAAKANDPALAIRNRHHHTVAKTVIEAIPSPAGHHQACRLQQLRAQPLHLLEMAQQTIPTLWGITQAEPLQGGLIETAAALEIVEGRSALRSAELRAKPTGRQGERLVELIATGELLAQTLLLRALEGLDRQLVLPCQLEDDIRETLALQLHQELDGVAPGTAGEAVVELLGR